jgi:hypothetical protein
MNAKADPTSHWPAWSIILIVLFGISPLLSALAAGSIGNALGCVVNEGGASRCIFGGHDIGDILADMFVLGWLMFLTLPMAGIAFLVWVVAVIVRRRRLRSGEA